MFKRLFAIALFAMVAVVAVPMMSSDNGVASAASGSACFQAKKTNNDSNQAHYSFYVYTDATVTTAEQLSEKIGYDGFGFLGTNYVAGNWSGSAGGFAYHDGAVNELPVANQSFVVARYSSGSVTQYCISKYDGTSYGGKPHALKDKFSSWTTYKVAASCDEPETVENLVENGSEQELVSEPETVTGGVVNYCLGTEDEPGTEWSTDIPTGKEAGTYYVWYKVVGDAGHGNSRPTMVEVTIAAKPVAKPTVTSPNTADGSDIALYGMLAIIALVGAGFSIYKKKLN